MNLIVISQAGGPQSQYLPWDTVIDPATGIWDWAPQGPGASSNIGGLLVADPIQTAILIGLGTDARCPADHPLAKYVEAGDPRGWWGDGVDIRADLSEQPLGGLMWLLERAVVSEENRRWAESLSMDALSPLVSCGACTFLSTSAKLWQGQNLITLDVTAIGSYGGRTFNQKYDGIWRSRA